MYQQEMFPHMNKSDELDQSYSHTWPHKLKILEIKLIDRQYINLSFTERKKQHAVSFAIRH